MKTFKKMVEEIANTTGTATSDTGSVSMPATAEPKDKKKVMLLKNIEKRKDQN